MDADCANLEEYRNNYTICKKAIFEFQRCWYTKLPLEAGFLSLNRMSTFKILSTQIYYSAVTFYMFYDEKRVDLLSYLSKNRTVRSFKTYLRKVTYKAINKNHVFLVVFKISKIGMYLTGAKRCPNIVLDCLCRSVKLHQHLVDWDLTRQQSHFL